MSRAFGPRAEDDKSGRECPGCLKPFLKGQYTTLVTIGPGDNEEARERKEANRPYNAVAIEAHYDCVYAWNPSEEPLSAKEDRK